MVYVTVVSTDVCVYLLGEGYKIAIHSHMEQPIMALSDIDLSPGFVTQLSVTPTLRETTDQGKAFR